MNREQTESDVERAYREAVDRMTPAEKIRRAAGLLSWSRDFLGRQLQKDSGIYSSERLKWEVARRIYLSQPVICQLIEEQIARVSD
jgi:hypothetical protein